MGIFLVGTSPPGVPNLQVWSIHQTSPVLHLDTIWEKKKNLMIFSIFMEFVFLKIQY